LPGPWVYIILYVYFYACVWRWLQVICPALAPDRRSVALLVLVAVSVWLDDHHHLADVDLQLLGVVTFPALWRDYRRFLLVEADCAENTVSEVRKVAYDFCAYLATSKVRGRTKAWHQAGPQDVVRFLDRPARSGRRRGQPLSPAARAHYIVAIRGLYRFAFQAGYLRRNPMELVRPPKVRPGAPRSLETDQLRTVLLAASDDPRMYLIVVLEYFGGLRTHEVAGLKVDDYYPLPRPGRIRVLGKGRKERWIPLHPEARAAIERYLTARDARPGQPLVANRRFPGLPLRAKSLSRLVSEFMHGCGVDESGHSLRHSAATALLAAEKGRNLSQVSAFLGHDSDRTTRRYTSGYDWELAEQVPKILDPRRGAQVRQ
jgi:integrase/recombinase XerC